MAVDANPVAVGMGETVLEETEEAAAAGDGVDHASELTDVPLPLLEADPLLGAEFVKDRL